MKRLVTGGAGFIGSHFAKLVERHEVVVLGCEIARGITNSC